MSRLNMRSSTTIPTLSKLEHSPTGKDSERIEFSSSDDGHLNGIADKVITSSIPDAVSQEGRFGGSDKEGYRADSESSGGDDSPQYTGDEEIPGPTPSSSSQAYGDTEEDERKVVSDGNINPKDKFKNKRVKEFQRNRRHWTREVQKYRAKKRIAITCNVSCSQQARNPPGSPPPSAEDDDNEEEGGAK